MALHPPPAGPPQLGPDGQPVAVPAAGPSALEDLGKHLSPEELVGIVAVLSDENQDRFKTIAMPIVSHMEPERQQMVGQLLVRLQAERAKERAAKEAAKAGEGIKVTVTPAAEPAPKAAGAKKKGGA